MRPGTSGIGERAVLKDGRDRTSRVTEARLHMTPVAKQGTLKSIIQRLD